MKTGEGLGGQAGRAASLYAGSQPNPAVKHESEGQVMGPPGWEEVRLPVWGGADGQLETSFPLR